MGLTMTGLKSDIKSNSSSSSTDDDLQAPKSIQFPSASPTTANTKASQVFSWPRKRKLSQSREGGFGKTLGSGAFGTVYQVQPQEGANPKTRAVKVINSEEKAQKEYELSRRMPLRMKPPIKNPDTGKTYLVMAELPGRSLEEVLNEPQAYSVEELLTLSLAVARAVKEQVHDRGIIHNDIKLENIMVDWRDKEHPVVHVIDVGLGKSAEISDVGICAGTPGYCAPEKLNREGSTEKSDVYSLGVLFYLMWIDSKARQELLGFLRQISTDKINAWLNSPDCLTYFKEHSLIHCVLQNPNSSISQERRSFLEGVQERLLALMQGMLQVSCDERYRSERVVEVLDQLLLDYKLSGQEQSSRQSIEFTHRIAIGTLQSLRKQTHSVFSRIDSVKVTILISLNRIRDDSQAIKEFVDQLRFKALYGSKTKQDIRETVDAIVQAVKGAREQLEGIRNSLKKQFSKTKRELELLADVNYVLKTKHKKYDLNNLDDLVLLTACYQRYIDRNGMVQSEKNSQLGQNNVNLGEARQFLGSSLGLSAQPPSVVYPETIEDVIGSPEVKSNAIPEEQYGQNDGQTSEAKKISPVSQQLANTSNSDQKPALLDLPEQLPTIKNETSLKPKQPANTSKIPFGVIAVVSLLLAVIAAVLSISGVLPFVVAMGIAMFGLALVISMTTREACALPPDTETQVKHGSSYTEVLRSKIQDLPKNPENTEHKETGKNQEVFSSPLATQTGKQPTFQGKETQNQTKQNQP